jgi:hypothetical protein
MGGSKVAETPANVISETSGSFFQNIPTPLAPEQRQ